MKLTKENLWDKIKFRQTEIFEHYLEIPNVDVSGRYCNKLRGDIHPDCDFVYYGEKLCFRDFAYTEYSGDVFHIAGKYYECDFYTAMRHINLDFHIGLEDGYLPNTLPTKKAEQQVFVWPRDEIPTEPKASVEIKIKWMDFLPHDKYWDDYHIKESTLRYFDTVPALKCWMTDYRYGLGLFHKFTYRDPMYAYLWPGTEKMQIYRPLANKRLKWRTNTNRSFIHGYRQLPAKGDLLIITKSRKDVMSLFELGYTSISPVSEGTILTEEQIEKLKDRFNTICVLYDNDEPGIKYSQTLSKKYKLDNIILPDIFPKDVSDTVKYMGRDSILEHFDKIELLNYKHEKTKNYTV